MQKNKSGEGSVHSTVAEVAPGSTAPDESVSVAAIYVRTSESKPKFHYSIDEQIAECWARCEQMGLTVAYIFVDEDVTGRNTDRPGFQDMLKHARAGNFDIVIFWKLDRFCRSLVDLVKTEEKLSTHGVALQSVTEYIDTSSPVGRFNFRNLASAAELESDLTSQRVQLGMRGLARENRWPNEQPPLGYSLDEDRCLDIIDEEAKLVERIFNLYIEERSMPEVAFNLNQEGISTKTGNEWTRMAVRKILTNTIYVGQYSIADYEEYVEEYQIISSELFERVKEIRYRFKHDQAAMSKERKENKSAKILSAFKKAKGDFQ